MKLTTKQAAWAFLDYVLSNSLIDSTIDAEATERGYDPAEFRREVEKALADISHRGRGVA